MSWLLQRRIRENKARLHRLGVAETVKSLQGNHVLRKRRMKKRKEKSVGVTDMDIVESVPKRRSKRLRDVEEVVKVEGYRVEDERPAKRSRCIRFDDMSCMTIVAPFSILSERITVLDLGRIHRGSYAHKYWSSSGSRYHHLYPVGYRATKVVFGKVFEMSIEESDTGPVFCVVDSVTNAVFRGETPTAPWTAVCIAQKTGQRISGPLFYGFSDPFTLQALAVNLYNASELSASVEGSLTQNLDLSEEELRAKEYMTITGIGPKVAEILSRVDVTGMRAGSPKSLQELARWLKESDENKEQFFFFLTTDESIPEKTRKWSQWYKQIAPKIVKNISTHNI